MKFIVERLRDHFGVGRYNPVERALAELVANAYEGIAEIQQLVIARAISGMHIK